MSSAAVTVSLTVDLPSEAYLLIEQLAKALQISVGHAAALTILAGQQAQRSMQDSETGGNGHDCD